MPIYEYQCSRCNCDFDWLVLSSRDKEIAKCPRCSSGEVKRLMSCFSKGSGAVGGAASSACSPSPGGFG